jgi:putative alpha-1,2-mannosidase
MTRESVIGKQRISTITATASGILATHKPAVWMGDYGHFSLMPGIGAPESGEYSTGFASRTATSVARPYCYSVRRECDSGEILAEMTATEHCGYLRFEFPKGSRIERDDRGERAVARYGVAGGGPKRAITTFPRICEDRS